MDKTVKAMLCWLLIGLVLGGVVGLLSGCEKIKAGKVVDKEFIPAHSDYYTTFIYVDDVAIPITNEDRIPDRWYIKIAGYDAQDKPQISEYEVGKETYESLELGDWWGAGK